MGVIAAALVTSQGQKNETSTISRESASAVQRSETPPSALTLFIKAQEVARSSAIAPLHGASRLTANSARFIFCPRDVTKAAAMTAHFSIFCMIISHLLASATGVDYTRSIKDAVTTRRSRDRMWCL
jgi:hypothetical protein